MMPAGTFANTEHRPMEISDNTYELFVIDIQALTHFHGLYIAYILFDFIARRIALERSEEAGVTLYHPN